MTKTILTSYTALLCIAMLMAGATVTLASEVTGTLSSDTSNNSQSTGNIGGSVSNDVQTTGNLAGTVSSGSSGSSRGSGSSANTPSGSVLGASAVNDSLTPGFPNAGVSPETNYVDQSLWSTLITLLKNAFSF